MTTNFVMYRLAHLKNSCARTKINVIVDIRFESMRITCECVGIHVYVYTFTGFSRMSECASSASNTEFEIDLTEGDGHGAQQLNANEKVI